LKSKNKSRLNIFFYISLFMLLSGCGLPTYEALDPPTSASTGSSYSVAFTSDNDTEIFGYNIYYKIYVADDILIRTEEKLFDPTTYENNDLDELPSGDTLPKELGFFKMGFIDKTTTFDPQIELTGGGHSVVIDFTSSSPQTSGSDPVITVDTTDMNNDYGIPARGVTYSEAGSSYPDYFNNKTYKRFVKNYEYDGSFVDADIEDAIPSGDISVTSIEIAFVVFSYGVSDTTLEPLSSIPVHVGTIRQDTISDNNLNEPILD
jgi:hypothetical protein